MIDTAAELAVGEIVDYPVDFAPDLDATDTLSSATATLGAAAVTLSGSVTIDATGKVALPVLRGVTAGASALLTVTAISVAGRTLKKSALVPVVAAR